MVKGKNMTKVSLGKNNMEYDKEAVSVKNMALRYLSEEIDRKAEETASKKSLKVITKEEVAQAFLLVMVDTGVDVIYKYMDKKL